MKKNTQKSYPRYATIVFLVISGIVTLYAMYSCSDCVRSFSEIKIEKNETTIIKLSGMSVKSTDMTILASIEYPYEAQRKIGHLIKTFGCSFEKEMSYKLSVTADFEYYVDWDSFKIKCDNSGAIYLYMSPLKLKQPVLYDNLNISDFKGDLYFFRSKIDDDQNEFTKTNGKLQQDLRKIGLDPKQISIAEKFAKESIIKIFRQRILPFLSFDEDVEKDKIPILVEFKNVEAEKTIKVELKNVN